MPDTQVKYDVTELARFKKNGSVDIVVSKVVKDGKINADIRLFMGPMATKKGLMVPVEQLEALLKLLEAKQGTLLGPTKATLVVGENTYKGKVGLDIRLFYEKDGKLLPTQKGVRVPLDVVSSLLETINKLKESSNG